MANGFRRLLNRPRSLVSEVLGRLQSLERSMGLLREAVGRLERASSDYPKQHLGLSGHEFRVFSQWGEDGIIQYLVNTVPIADRRFVEFGVEHYQEANTRFLLVNDNWSGLVMDGSEENVRQIRQSELYWRYNLKAATAFITRENINDLLREHGFMGPLGILSIDIDGNDYWVWESLKVVDPAIVITEYNARFGPERAVTVPYDPTFRRFEAHRSGCYYGASLAAFEKLGKKKGYSLVGCNTAGNNAFFVRDDLRPASLRALSPSEAYVRNQFREARGAQGELLFLDGREELALFESMPLVEV